MSDATIQILYVEDDLVDRMAFERFVKTRGLAYDYTLAESAQAARAFLSSRRYDVVISDYALGDGTCLDLLNEYRDATFIVVTGTGSEETAVEAMKLGARDYLIKDPDANHLKVLPVTVQSVLQRCRAEAELKQYREHLEELVRQRTTALEAECRERMLAEEALRLSDERLRVALAAAEMGTWRWDATSRKDTRDAGLNRLLGLPPIESTQDIEDFFGRIHPEDRDEVQSQFDHAIHDKGVYLAEFRIVRPDGEVRWLRDQGKPFYDDTGKLVYMTGATFDITERKTSEAEKTELENQLHQAQKLEALGQLAGGVAHDFGNLATVILGHAELIRLIVGNRTDITENLDVIEQVAKDASNLTKSLLAFSRRLPAEKQTVDLRKHALKSLHICRRLLPATIEVVEQIGGEVPAVVHADPTQLEQILLNLIINARDAMPSGGRLTITVRIVDTNTTCGLPGVIPAGLCAALEVADNGCGMSPDVQARIFDPFFTTKERGKGTGLGLAVVLGIANNHGGQISVQSTVGKGTTFTVLLPLTARVIEGCSPDKSQEPAQGNGEYILLAEDDPHIRSLLASTLRSVGYSVVDVGDGEGILMRLKEPGIPYRLFLFDVDLPKLGGLECLRKLRSEGCTIPAVLMTAMLCEDAQLALPKETTLLRKPFMIETLRKRIAETLASSGS